MTCRERTVRFGSRHTKSSCSRAPRAPLFSGRSCPVDYQRHSRPWATDDAHAWAEPQGNAKTQPSRPADKHPIPIPPILTHSLTHSPRFALQKSIPPSLPLPLTLSSTSSIQGAARPSVAAAAAVAAKWALPFAGSPIQPGGPPLPFPSPPTGGREGRQGQRQKTETAQGPSRDVRPPAHRPPLEYRSTVVP